MNTFQCILVTDSIQTYAIFKYADDMIQWTSGDNQRNISGREAQVGFNSGDGVKYASVPGSLTAAIINITKTSNVGIPGQWVSLISSTIVTVSGKPRPMKTMLTYMYLVCKNTFMHYCLYKCIYFSDKNCGINIHLR